MYINISIELDNIDQTHSQQGQALECWTLVYGLLLIIFYLNVENWPMFFLLQFFYNDLLEQGLGLKVILCT